MITGDWWATENIKRDLLLYQHKGVYDELCDLNRHTAYEAGLSRAEYVSRWKTLMTMLDEVEAALGEAGYGQPLKIVMKGG